MIAAVLAMAFVSCSIISIAVNTALLKRWETKISCYIGSEASADLPLLSVLYPEFAWTAYAQSDPCSVVNSDFPNRKADLTVVSYLGEPDRIMFFPLLAGRLPLQNEYDACALDANTSFALFNGTELDGSSIRMDGRILRVVGVVDVDSPLLLTPTAEKTGQEYLATDDRDSMILLTSALGVEVDPYELSGIEVARLLWIPCVLPWALAAVFLLSRIRTHRGRWRDIANVALWLLVIGLILLAMQCVPVRFLPSRWSDLSFYGEQIRALSARLYRVPSIFSGQLRRDALWVLLWCAGACITLELERMWIRCEKSLQSLS